MILTDPIELINYAKDNAWNVCVYGMGALARNIGFKVLDLLQLNIDFVADRSRQQIKKNNTKGYNVIGLTELLCYESDIFVLVCVGKKNHDELKALFQKNAFIHYCFIQDITSCNEVIDLFYESRIDEEKKKIAVYTCITGDYDDALEPYIFLKAAIIIF